MESVCLIEKRYWNTGVELWENNDKTDAVHFLYFCTGLLFLGRRIVMHQKNSKAKITVLIQVRMDAMDKSFEVSFIIYETLNDISQWYASCRL